MFFHPNTNSLLDEESCFFIYINLVIIKINMIPMFYEAVKQTVGVLLMVVQI
jgi:hypothetical protein